MKILLINGSHRNNGNTKFLLDTVTRKCEDLGAKCKMTQLANKKIEFCLAHDSTYCREKGCPLKDDVARILKKMEEADAIVIGSPCYMGDVTGKLKALMDRAVILRRRNASLSQKIGAAIAVGGAQGGGQEHTLASIHRFFLINNMTIVSDGIPTSHFGVISLAKGVGEAEKDTKAIEMAQNLASRITEEANLRKNS